MMSDARAGRGVWTRPVVGEIKVLCPTSVEVSRIATCCTSLMMIKPNCIDSTIIRLVRKQDEMGFLRVTID